jgi:glycosyltransferase involved in cell wall biosynthesis
MIASDFLIFTSIHEGSPNVIKEALACNLPIISVDVADVKQRIEHIQGCYLVDSYSAQELSNCLKNALDYDYSNYKSIHHVMDLDENILIKKLIQVYKSVLAS